MKLIIILALIVLIIGVYIVSENSAEMLAPDPDPSVLHARPIFVDGLRSSDANLVDSSISPPQKTDHRIDNHRPELHDEAVQIAWFYGLPDDKNADFIQSNFNAFLLTRHQHIVRDKLKEIGSQALILRYLRFDTIHDPGSCDKRPYRNQVANKAGDFCWISENHPDWFLLDADGNRMVQPDGNTMMDPGHPGWRAFWLERARQLSRQEDGWDGVFLDNVEASLTKRKRREHLPANYPTNVSYQAAVEGFLAFLYSSYFQPHDRPLYANIIETQPDSDTWFRYLRYLDGSMEEAFAVDWSDGYRSTKSWEAHLQRVERTQALGKRIIVVSQGAQEDVARQLFAFASYLLVSNGDAMFRYTHNDHYRDIWLYENYSLDLGKPLGPRYKDGPLWRRNFSQGSVSVNQKTRDVNIVIK